MSQPTAAGRTGESWTAEAPAAASTGTGMANRNALVTSDGKISMAESVVQVASSGLSFGPGIAVEAGATEAAIDLNVVVDYGLSIAELGRTIQCSVQQAVEGITGLKIVEVGITVDDIHLPPEDAADPVSHT